MPSLESVGVGERQAESGLIVSWLSRIHAALTVLTIQVAVLIGLLCAQYFAEEGSADEPQSDAVGRGEKLACEISLPAGEADQKVMVLQPVGRNDGDDEG